PLEKPRILAGGPPHNHTVIRVEVMRLLHRGHEDRRVIAQPSRKGRGATLGRTQNEEVAAHRHAYEAFRPFRGTGTESYRRSYPSCIRSSANHRSTCCRPAVPRWRRPCESSSRASEIARASPTMSPKDTSVTASHEPRWSSR